MKPFSERVDKRLLILNDLQRCINFKDYLGACDCVRELQFLGASVSEFRGISDTQLSGEELVEILQIIPSFEQRLLDFRGRRNYTVESVMDDIGNYLLKKEDQNG